MRVIVPEFKSQNELFAYLKSNRKQLIAQKCSMEIKSDDGANEPFNYGCLELRASDLAYLGKSVTKSKKEVPELSADEIEVEVVANMAGWCDSYLDVLIPDSWKKTISEKGASNKQLIYHLKNHRADTDSIIGGNVSLESRWLDLSQFNIESDIKQGQALVGLSTVKKKYDAKCFYLYADDEIKQHSIGLRYIKIHLCMNSDEEMYKYEKSNWDKYYQYVINKDKVDAYGYFWAVTEIKLLEYSAVLYGANELTTVQEASKGVPSTDTAPEPSKDTLDYASLTEKLKLS